MKLLVSLVASAILFSLCGPSYGANDVQYKDAICTIKDLLPGISSSIRNETYGYININKCTMNYSVSGFYPVGTPYSKVFANIDFSSLDYKDSKTGSDVSHYIILYFDQPFDLTEDSAKRTSHSVVIDAASDGQAKTLFDAFLRLGELCRKGEGAGGEKQVGVSLDGRDR